MRMKSVWRTLTALFCIALPLPPVAYAARLTLGGPAPAVRTEAQLASFLDDLETQEFALNEALVLEEYFQWKGLEPHRVAEDGRLLNDLHSRRDYAAIIERWHGRVTDPVLARRLELHHRDFLQSRVDPALPIELSDLQTALQDRVEKFRFTVDGGALTRTAVSVIINTSPDRAARRAAFLARPQIATAIRGQVLGAMRLHDRIARQEGFASGAVLGLDLRGLTPAQVLADLDAFEKETRPAFLEMLEQVRKDLGVERVEPWDIDYWLHTQEATAGDAYPREPGIPRLMDLVRALGFKPEALAIDVKIWDVPVGGIMFPVRVPFDGRLLTNPFTGSDFYETLFHEYGHAVNAALTDPRLPAVFLRGDDDPLSEGLAETLGHFAYDRHWIGRTTGLPPARSADLERIGKLQLLLWLRRSIGLAAWVEVHAYEDLGGDLDSLYRDSYRRFVGVELPPGDYVGTVDMYGTGPLYVPAYLYANMIATQLRAAMRAQFAVDDLSREPRVAGWLTQHFYAQGASIPWAEKIQRATGKRLSTQALSEYLRLD